LLASDELQYFLGKSYNQLSNKLVAHGLCAENRDANH